MGALESTESGAGPEQEEEEEDSRWRREYRRGEYDALVGDQSGKVVLITGFSRIGFGYAIAALLASKGGATVILGCEHESVGDDAVNKIKENARARGIEEPDVTHMALNVASMASIEAFGEAFSDRYSKLDVLINNAGVYDAEGGGRKLTADGFELMFATNNLGHFKLTAVLLPFLEASGNGRIVNLSSFAASLVWDFHLTDLNSEKQYRPRWRWAETKFMSCLFTHELNQRLQEHNMAIISVTSDPGITIAEIQNQLPGTDMLRDLGVLGENVGEDMLVGALPTVRAAIDPNLKGNEYIMPANYFVGPPIISHAPRHSHNKKLQAEFWQQCEQFLGIELL